MAWERHLSVLTRLLEETGMEAVTKWGKPTYMHAGRNVAHSSNTFEVANRAFRLPAFLDVLVGHPLLQSPALACLLGRALRPKLT